MKRNLAFQRFQDFHSKSWKKKSIRYRTKLSLQGMQMRIATENTWRNALKLIIPKSAKLLFEQRNYIFKIYTDSKPASP
jgi:hypothetical protein